MFQSTAIITYDFKSDVLRADCSLEINRYYKQLFYYSCFNVYKGQMFTPRHGSHITIYRPEKHGFVSNNPARYHGDLINFRYNPEEIYSGGFHKGFLGFYMPIYSEDIDLIKQNLGIIDREGDSLHLTLFTDKKKLADKKTS